MNDDIDTLQCWECSGGDGGANRCPKCSGTGRLFWAGGYPYPYTPDGEKRARETLRRLTVRA